ncbi:sigma-54 dependent transcriptional regulator [Bdellovibrionota bacterium FG-1]
MQRLPLILICDDDSVFHLAIKQAVRGHFECKSAYNTDEALAIVRKHPIDVLLLDIQMRSPAEGMQSIRKFLEIDPELSIAMSSGITDYTTVRDAMILGASDYIGKELNSDALIHRIRNLLEKRQLLRRKGQQNFEALAVQKQNILIGQSPALLQLRKTIDRLRNNAANVVITGETGTGKEVVARQLRGALPDGSLAPFVAVDSSTIQSTMAESILFGHEKGAFTGAEKSTKGIFEEAHGGIVYFDEIANMPLEIQAKLLRVLQEKEVTRLGSAKTLQLEFRVVCATNKNLEEMAKQGQFKDDLLQRLNVLPIELVPLRERAEDIPLLTEYFLRKNRHERGDIHFSSEALDILKAYSWPGNVRELGNLVAYVIAMTDSPELEVADLPPKLRDAARAATKTTGNAAQSSDATSKEGLGFYEQVAAFESTLLQKDYDHYRGNVSKMALSLGMDRSHLYTKLKEYGIHTNRPPKNN